MAKRFNKFWYLDETSVHNAGLFNLRDSDLVAGGQIRRGEIIVGQCGYAVAETSVLDFSDEVCDYCPNRCVEWHGHFLTCMALDDLPTGKLLRKAGKNSLRHKHYVVAELDSANLASSARKMGATVIRSHEGRNLTNLEIFTVANRTPKHRRAKLL